MTATTADLTNNNSDTENCEMKITLQRSVDRKDVKTVRSPRKAYTSSSLVVRSRLVPIWSIRSLITPLLDFFHQS